MSASLYSLVKSQVNLDEGLRAVVHLSRHCISDLVSLPPEDRAVNTWLLISAQLLPNICTPTVNLRSSSNVNLPCLMLGMMHCLYLYLISRLVLLGKYSEISLHFNYPMVKPEQRHLRRSISSVLHKELGYSLVESSLLWVFNSSIILPAI